MAHKSGKRQEKTGCRGITKNEKVVTKKHVEQRGPNSTLDAVVSDNEIYRKKRDFASKKVVQKPKKRNVKSLTVFSRTCRGFCRYASSLF